MKVAYFFVIFFVLVGAATSAIGAQDKLCFGCHDRKDYVKAVVHQPVAKGECDRCHNPHVAKYKGLIQQEVAKLCLSCHVDIGKAGSDKTLVHKPVRNGQCLACHDPHSSSVKGLLREKNQKETCIKCHESLAKNYEFTHSPFAKGECSACHQPHQSERLQLLVAEPDALCRSCHKGSLADFHKNFPAKPAACLTCHNPHGSSRKGLIKDFLHEPFKTGCTDCHEVAGGRVGVEKCLECHGEVRDQALAVHNHLTSATGNSCVNCHSPHASDDQKLFKSKLEQVCRECHRDTFKNYADKLHSHPNSGSCANCHQVHGSNHLAMLKGNGNQVCSECHKSQGQFTHPVGEGVFDPRTGLVLTCVTCHYPHGTDFPYNLKQEGSKDLCVQCHRGY
jgi:predicted CXXCH cytochrome family protein